MYRRKSPDSSDSSDSSDSDDQYQRGSQGKVKKEKKDKDKKDKKEKKDKKDKSDKKDKVKGEAPVPNFPQPPAYSQGHSSQSHQVTQPQHPTKAPMSYGFDDPHASFPSAPSQPHFSGGGHAQAAPPSGYRVPLTTDANFPPADMTGYPPLYDADGVSPIFIGSALFENSVHPCKIGPHLNPPAAVAYGGREHGHHGRYDLLPFVPDQMEWVPTSQGRIPHGRRAIEGGYEEDGNKLYHGLAVVDGVRVPGKAGEHLRGCNVSFGGREIAVADHEILCWK